MSTIYIRLDSDRKAEAFVSALKAAGLDETLAQHGGGTISYQRFDRVPGLPVHPSKNRPAPDGESHRPVAQVNP